MSSFLAETLGSPVDPIGDASLVLGPTEQKRRKEIKKWTDFVVSILKTKPLGLQLGNY